MVDQNAALGLIDELRVAVPEEVRAAKRINAEGERIIEKAQEEAERIVARAQEQAAFLIDERGLTQSADAQSRVIIGDAHRDADEIRRGADEYAVGVLVGLEGDVVKTLTEHQEGHRDARRAARRDRGRGRGRRLGRRRGGPLGGRGRRAVQQRAVTGGRPDDGPLAWNVAGLLADEPGAERIHEVAGVAIDLEDLDPGRADLRPGPPPADEPRDPRRRATSTRPSQLECSRCLRDITYPVDVRIEEEYLPAIDLTTGRPLPTDDEPDVARLTDHHELDLETPVREAIQLAEPIAPLYRPDCPGLCIVCGLPLDEGVHDHPDRRHRPATRGAARLPRRRRRTRRLTGRADSRYTPPSVATRRRGPDRPNASQRIASSR